MNLHGFLRGSIMESGTRFKRYEFFPQEITETSSPRLRGKLHNRVMTGITQSR
jgi:hypothetical protein